MESVTFEKSSHLAGATFDAARGALRVTFRGGAVYEYRDVPPVAWEGLCRADSAGKFLAAEIKPAYPCERVS